MSFLAGTHVFKAFPVSQFILPPGQVAPYTGLHYHWAMSPH